MLKIYEKYIEDNDGTDVAFPGYFLGKNAKIKAKHQKDKAKKPKSRSSHSL